MVILFFNIHNIKTLLGPVSIADNYHGVSKKLIVDFLKKNAYNRELARLVKPRKSMKSYPFKTREINSFAYTISDIGELSEIISSIEEHFNGIPILLKHYLKLGGEIIGFNLDPQFSNVLDGLIAVDVTKISPKYLKKYMGENGMENYLNIWKKIQSKIA